MAAVSQPDLSMSRMSRVSTGSSGSSQDVRPETSAFTQISSPSYHMQPNNTSTPARPQSSCRIKQYEDMNNTSAFSRVSVAEERRNNLGYEHVNSPHSQQYKPDVSDSPHYKNGRETTPDRDNRLTPDARLEMLTHGGGSAFSPTSSQSGQSPHSNYSSPTDQRSRSQDADMSVRSGQGASPGWRGQQGQPASGSGQRPVKATHPGYPPRSRSPGRVQQPYDNRNATSPTSTPHRKGNILVSRQGPRPYGAQRNITRARPASAFGAPMNNSFQSDQSLNSSTNNSRPSRLELNNTLPNQSHSDVVRASYDDSYHSGPNSAHINGPVHNTSVNHRTVPNRMERPKSVPPTMFNQPGSSDSDSSYNNEHQNHVGSKGTPPVPPPRKTRDILSTGRYSVLREPSSPIKPVLGGSTSRGQWNNSISPSGTVGSAGPRGQNPTSAQRIGPPPKSPGSKPPVPKPLNTDDGEQKANSIWYEYGCV